MFNNALNCFIVLIKDDPKLNVWHILWHIILVKSAVHSNRLEFDI